MKKYLVELYIYDDGRDRLVSQNFVFAETETQAISKARDLWPHYSLYRVARITDTLETK